MVLKVSPPTYPEEDWENLSELEKFEKVRVNLIKELKINGNERKPRKRKNRGNNI